SSKSNRLGDRLARAVEPWHQHDVGALVDSFHLRQRAGRRGDGVADQFAGPRRPAGEGIAETAVGADRVGALPRLADGGAAIEPLSGTAVPGAVDVGEVPLIAVDAEVR